MNKVRCRKITSISFIRQLPQPHMAHEIGLVLHLQCLSNKQVEEFGSLCGGNQSAAWHTWKPSFGDVLLRVFSFYSSALLEPDPKMYWSHASCTFNANSNQQPCKATQGFDVATDSGMSQSKLILFGCSHTLFCSPLPQYRHSSHHMLTRESSLATLWVPSATSTLLPDLVRCSFQSPLTPPFLTCLLPAPLVRPLSTVWIPGIF